MGVLIIGIGRGTKALSSFLTGVRKEYHVICRFGIQTDTGDGVGVVTKIQDASHVTQELIQHHLKDFRGRISQVPPLFSALKINGDRVSNSGARMRKAALMGQYASLANSSENELEENDNENENKEENGNGNGNGNKANGSSNEEGLYEQVGIKVPELKARELFVHRLELEKFEYPLAYFSMNVSSGFYVRSFVSDLAAKLNTVAVSVELCRSNQGNVDLGSDCLLQNVHDIYNPDKVMQAAQKSTIPIPGPPPTPTSSSSRTSSKSNYHSKPNYKLRSTPKHNSPTTFNSKSNSDVLNKFSIDFDTVQITNDEEKKKK